ncbi:MAG: DUF2829 domain-containing protein [Spirochaetes bacterium]|nr:MAG: DUF2829 domain-containing protein [Spirochaetota bacterium]
MTQDYYGTKRITAWEQDRDGKPGYAVKYKDGYISWSPKETFEEAYQPITAMYFSSALVALKDGLSVSRAGWNGKGMWLELFRSQGGTYKSRPLGDHIMMATADGKYVPWLCSQTDALADDWMIV